MFKEKTIYKWEIAGTFFFVEKEITKCPDGREQYDYWLGHRFYDKKLHAIGQMDREVPEHLLFDELLETFIRFNKEVVGENDDYILD